MKVTDIQIDVVRHEVPAIGPQPAREVEHGLLRVLTDAGIEGNCFIGAWIPAETLFSPILNVVKPELVGREPFEREWLWRRMQFLSTRFSLHETSWAPVDVALWDIAGKAAGLPVFKLLGAQRDEIPAYASYYFTHDLPEAYVREGEEAVSSGFGAYKIHPGALDTRNAIKMVAAVRETLGDDMSLMLDPDCSYDFRRALSVGMALDDNRFHWFEDPVRHHDLDAIAELSRRLLTPLCMTDQSSTQLFDSVRYIRVQALRIVRGTALMLGITGLRKLCALAESFGLNCEIGTAGNGSLNAANLHVMLSVGNCDFYEHLMPVEQQHFGMTSYPTPDERGMMGAPDSLGLGFDVDWDWIKHHKVTTLR